MSRKYKFKVNDKLYFVSFSVVYWIDLFIREEYKKVVLESWKYCMAKKGLEIYGWCIMTSHIHLIIGSKADKLENIMRNMKRHTAELLHQTIKYHRGESRKEWMLWLMERAGKKNSNNINFQLWQQHNHPIELVSPEMAWQKFNYIHDNPVKAGFVSKTEDYLYSSAGNYNNRKGLIDICYLDPLILTV